MTISEATAVPVRPATTAAEATSRAAPVDVAQFIRGTTLVYPVLGSPIAQVKAPMLYNALFASTGVNAVVVPIEVAAADYPVLLKGLFRARNVPGAFITIPHKPATVDLLDDCSDAVRIAGACNAIVRRADGTLYGELFDGIGFVRAAERTGFTVARSHCLVVGAGGAGAAIAAALAAGGAARVRLFDTRSDHARELAAQLQRHFAASPSKRAKPPRRLRSRGQRHAAGDGAHRSATGRRRPDHPGMLIGEIVMKREITPLVDAARTRVSPRVWP